MPRSRYYLVFFFLIAFLVILQGRLFYIQVIEFERFSHMAAGQHNEVLKIEPRRGTIFDRYMEPLAINLDTPSVYCNPRIIKEKEHTARILSRILDMRYGDILSRLKRDKAFLWLKRGIARAEADEIKRQSLKGIYLLNESKRKYHNDNMASHILGFAGTDNTGLEGLELYFDDKLKGSPGWRSFLRDARRNTVLFDDANSMPAQNGHNIVLTIDSVIQYIAENEIKNMAEKFNASSATAVVMDPFTGEVLAMANYPDYDLNMFRSTPRGLMKNAAVSNVFEPGSVFKIVTASAALNEGYVSLTDEIFCENGEYRVGGRILHDYHEYGRLSFEDVVANSSNIGVVKVAEKMGKDKVYEYIEKFGFGRKTGIDMPGEVSGISRPPSIWSGSDITTIPIGQGIAVTSLQMASAVSVIANGGYLMKPYIVDKITTWEGGLYKDYGPFVKHEVIDTGTCDKMKKVLCKVVSDGTGRKVRSDIYTLCGKTGTAQMVNPDGGYFPDKYYATFIGFAPADDPQVSIVVIAGDPHPVHFGGSVAGPAFKNIAERTLKYLGTGTLSEK